MTGMCYTRTCMGRLADETFVSLLFIVLLAFFDYNMDMLKGGGDFSCRKKKYFEKETL